MTIARVLAEWALGAEPAAAPESARRDACLRLLDGAGTRVAAIRLDAAPYARAGAGPFADAVLVHALDYDDTHPQALVHPTAVVLPAAFAEGERLGATGAEVLAAAIVGYEVIARLGAAVRHGFHARGFHATSVCGVFAVALIAARLRGLSAGQATHALGIAGSAAAGSLEFLDAGTATKPIHAGLAVSNGLLAAALAERGAEGPDTIFEGRHGLFRSYAGADVDPAAVTKTLGIEWEVSRVEIKAFPACRLLESPLRAVGAARASIRASEVDRMTIEIPEDSVPIVCEPAGQKRRPRTAYEAKFSLAWTTAAMMLDGAVGVDAFTADALSRSDVAELAGRVDYRAVPFDGAPAAHRAAVEIVTRDGRTRVVPDPVTDTAAVTDAGVLAKFRANGGDDETCRRILGLQSEPDVRGVLR